MPVTIHAPRVRMFHLKNLSKAAGNNWFNKDTMRFWKTRLPQYAYETLSHYWFISSDAPHGKRGFTIRKLSKETGSTSTEGEFLQYSTRQEAMAALAEIIKQNIKDTQSGL